jgi:peroxiredoxin
MCKWIAPLSAVVSLGLIALTLRVSVSNAADKPLQNPAIGKPAPAFTLQNMDGKNVSLSDESGKIVVLEWTNPDCPIVQRHYHAKTMTTLHDKYKSKNVVWLAINSSNYVTNHIDQKWASEQGITYPILNDAPGDVGRLYGATNTPQMFVIGTDGTLLYKGAIDNDRNGDLETGKINYVDQAVTEILASKPVSVPETKPYGCTVKYK